MKTALLVGHYHDPAPERAREFVTCLERNLANDCIDDVHLFAEDTGSAPLHHAKLHLVPHRRRLSFEALFGYANQQLGGHRVIVANADIHFDTTLARLHGVALAGRMACLSRWDVLADGSLQFFDHPSSQDAWIFDAPLPPIDCNFELGLLGCDNRLAWQAQAAGLAVFNPGRSVRACHLHLSQVRRYTAQQRLGGPVLSIAATTLGTPWLSFVLPCRGQPGALRSTLDSLRGQRRSSCYVVGSGVPLEGVVAVAPPGGLGAGAAYNQGARAADDDAILCFVEPGTRLAAGFDERVLAELPADGFVTVGSAAIVCRRSDWLDAGGCDEAMLEPADQAADLAHRLRLAGLREQASAAVLQPPAGPAQGRVLGAAADDIRSGYRRVKTALLDELGPRSQSPASLRDIYRGIARRRLRERGLAPGLPDARVAFAETTGCAVARLQAGVSSHLNIDQALHDIPPALVGKAFTRVVAYRTSPIEIEFLSAGKLYLLVGTDWYGYRPLLDWLAANGFREPLPDLVTAADTRFEAWSVIGDAGETLVVPAQAMLVADSLERRP